MTLTFHLNEWLGLLGFICLELGTAGLTLCAFYWKELKKND